VELLDARAVARVEVEEDVSQAESREEEHEDSDANLTKRRRIAFVMVPSRSDPAA